MSEFESKLIMAQNIAYHMKRLGISRNELCKALGFNYSTVSEWLNAKKYPRIDKIEAMAEYFGVSKSDLVEDCSLEQADIYFYKNAARALANDINVTEKLQEVLSMDDSIGDYKYSDEQLNTILKYARFIKDE